MTSKDLTLYFYTNIIGHSVEEEKESATCATIQYLLDSNVNENDIIKVLMSYKTDTVTPHNLPDELWIINPQIKENKATGEFYQVQDNLIKRNEFYYHSKLMLRSSLPKIVNGVEVIEKYYCEPRCRFTIYDLIDYFCEKIQTHKAYMNTRYSINSIFTNLKVYKDISHTIDPLDIMMFSIDCAASKGNYHFSTFMQLQQYLEETINDLQEKVAYMRAYGYDKIVWRADQCLLQSSELK